MTSTLDAILPSIRQAIRLHEIGLNSPYRLSFAGKGNSGGSFGVYQGDTNTDPDAAEVLQRILTAATLPPAEVSAIMVALRRHCLENPLTDQQSNDVNQALNSIEGRAEVDQLDGKLEKVVLAGVNRCIDSANAAHKSIAPEALLYIACWVNMSGPPNQLSAWIGGKSTYDIPSPKAIIRATDLRAYLSRTDYFKKNLKNFEHLQQVVSEAAKLLPKTNALS